MPLSRVGMFSLREVAMELGNCGTGKGYVGWVDGGASDDLELSLFGDCSGLGRRFLAGGAKKVSRVRLAVIC